MTDIQLKKKNNGYWGCMDKDVRDASAASGGSARVVSQANKEE